MIPVIDRESRLVGFYVGQGAYPTNRHANRQNGEYEVSFCQPLPGPEGVDPRDPHGNEEKIRVPLNAMLHQLRIEMRGVGWDLHHNVIRVEHREQIVDQPGFLLIDFSRGLLLAADRAVTRMRRPHRSMFTGGAPSVW